MGTDHSAATSPVGVEHASAGRATPGVGGRGSSGRVIGGRAGAVVAWMRGVWEGARSWLDAPDQMSWAQCCLWWAAACFTVVALAAAAMFMLVYQDGPAVGLVGLVALGLALCIPTLLRLATTGLTASERPADLDGPADLVAAPRVMVEPVWRCLEPLPDDGRPLADQVARRIQEAIDAGRYLPGAVLPSDLAIGRHLKVSATTVGRGKARAVWSGYLRWGDAGGFVVSSPSSSRRPPG